ncbi:MAG: hypothetical protein CVV51_06260 [Spirochaetae bacterium HGW-Spirochaetae-7]|nr:MAG: hypothetical protein CVV51_06260 [Spirochaetae bacterium HGW-Spirochaetae-7]
MRLAIGLIAYLAITSMVATLVPQGLSDEAYGTMYPNLVAELVTQTGFGHFFRSILFMIPSFLFFANLSACTIKRAIREFRKKSGRHHGPDILHMGLMLLVIGSIWSFSGHRQGSVVLAPGDGVNLPDGAVLHLDDFRFERYDDGRPRDWVSVVSILKDGKPVKDRVEVRVNSPLRYAGMTFYQASYEEVPGLALVDEAGTEVVLSQGEERIINDVAYFFMAPEGDGALAGMGSGKPKVSTGRAVIRVGDGMNVQPLKAGPGDMVGSMRMVGLKTQLATGIEAVSDPGFPLVFIALALIATGTAWTFAQKLKEGV